ncbi:MAG: hypothetical protein P1V29_04820 [Gammaproteobacteria bacterium]|nr:hypothetical protein [Gammaproteobacteria bacterium]
MDKSRDASLSIDEALIAEGTAQLNSEIKVLENWLAELEAAKSDDTETLAARKSYTDMLTSRRDMLNSLSEHGLSQREPSLGGPSS